MAHSAEKDAGRRTSYKKHTRTSTTAGPDFCAECSATAQEWVSWPCSASNVCFFCGRQCDPFCGDWVNHEPSVTSPANGRDGAE